MLKNILPLLANRCPTCVEWPDEPIGVVKTNKISNRLYRMKRILALSVIFFLLLPSLSVAQTDTVAVDTAAFHQDKTCPEVLLQTSMGNIRVALYNDTPLHRDNFLKWVRMGYYDGCIFQRVIKDFMIQGGDPSSRKVTPGKVERFDTAYTVPAEIRYPKYYHKRGQLCAAREGDDVNPQRASAPCDFYITWGRNYTPRQMEYTVEKMQREQKWYAVPNEQVQAGYIKYGGVPHLDNGYTVFGEVLEGMDVVDRIQNVATDHGNNDRPLEDVVIIKATVVKP